MEEILKDTGLSGYAHILRENNYNAKYFRRILTADSNAPALRQYVIQDCGLTSAQVLSICDKL